MNDDSKKTIEKYCLQESVNRTEAVERGIAKLKDDLK